MNRIITVIAFVLLVLALIWGVFQLNEGKKKASTINTQETTILDLETALEKERSSKELAIQRTEELVEANEQLEGEKSQLNKQIQRLEKEISDLKLRINTQRETIEGVRKDMQEREAKIADLQGQIAALDSAKKADRAKIKDLEDQQTAVATEMDNLRATNYQTLSEKDALVNDLMDKQEEEELYRNNLDIIEKTMVNFQQVTLRKDKRDKPIKRLKKSNWDYTTVELSLYHDEQELLVGQEFELTVIDADTGQPVALRESNPEFPDSENNAKSMRFTFEKNPITLEHSNTQEKTSNNYQLQLTYVKNNRKLPMKFGVLPIIANGRVVARGE